jgi:hypothetical protein
MTHAKTEHLKNTPWFAKAGAACSIVPISRFVGPSIFALKGGGYGCLFSLTGLDEEGLTEQELDARVRQIEGALRTLPEGSCLYQYARVMSGFDLPRQKTAFRSRVDATSATNSEVQQLNLLNAAQAQQLSGIRASFWPSSQSSRVSARCVGSLRPRCAYDRRVTVGRVDVSPSRLVLAPSRSEAKEPPEPARIRRIAGKQDGTSERRIRCVPCPRARVAGIRGCTSREGRHTVPGVVAPVPQATCPSDEVEACCALEPGYPTLGDRPCALRCLSLGCHF